MYTCCVVERKNIETIYLGLIDRSNLHISKEKMSEDTKSLLIKMLDKLGINSIPDFGLEKGQKPRFVDESSRHFNLSHGGSLGVCAIGDIPLGVDLEPIEEHRDW